MILPFLSLIQIILLFIILDPLRWFVLTTPGIIAVVAGIVALGVYGVFVERERAYDERDEIHRMLAGRVAFHVGAAFLTIGIAVQSLQDQLDPWLVAALVVMIVAKTIARGYADARR